MESVLGLLGLIVIVAGVYWLTQLKDHVIDSAVGAVNRRVHSGTHRERVSFASQQYFFTIDQPDEVLLTALKAVCLRTQAPLIVPAQTYLVDADASTVRWAHGTAAQTLFRATALIATADGTDRGVVLGYHDTATSDGLVAGVGAMKALRRDIQAALRQLDPGVEGSTVQWS